MIRTVEAAIDEHGAVRLLEGVELPAPRRTLVTILEEEPSVGPNEPALLSEAALHRPRMQPMCVGALHEISRTLQCSFSCR